MGFVVVVDDRFDVVFLFTLLERVLLRIFVEVMKGSGGHELASDDADFAGDVLDELKPSSRTPSCSHTYFVAVFLRGSCRAYTNHKFHDGDDDRCR